MPIRRHVLLACLCLLVPLGTVAVSAAHIFRASAASALPSYGGSQPAPSIFGIDSYTIDNNKSNFDNSFKRAKNLGVLISLGGASNACSISALKSKPTHCPPTTAADLKAYKSFLKTELLRYRKNVSYYESWTEPNHKSSWGNTGPNPAQYAALLKAQYSVFQAVNRSYHLHLKLLFGGSNEFSANSQTPGVTAVLPFTHQVLVQLGGAHAFDGIALHGYVYPPNEGPATKFYTNVQGIPVPSGASGPYPAQGCDSTPSCYMDWSQQLSAYEQEFTNHGYSSEPLWLSEFGWPGNAKANGSSYPSYSVQAANLRAAYGVLLKLPFVKGAFWYNLYDYKPGIPSCATDPSAPLCNPDPEPFAHYGLLTYGQAKKPAAYAFTTLAKANKGR
jgi:hypothetical protein